MACVSLMNTAGLPAGPDLGRLTAESKASEGTAAHMPGRGATLPTSAGAAAGDPSQGPVPRGGRRTWPRLELSEAQWRVLGDVGGNVSALHRYLVATAADPSRVVPLHMLHRVVCRDREAGRVLPRRGVRERRAEVTRRTRQTFERLGSWAGEGSGGARDAASGAGWVGRVVHTTAVRAVSEAAVQAVASRTVACVYGGTGQGKTVALATAVALLPREPPVAWVAVPVRCTVPRLRRALREALRIDGNVPHHPAAADGAVAGALSQGRVLIVDEAQRLTPASLDHIQGLLADPGCDLALVLAGAGSERAVGRVPHLASRVVWQHVTRMTTSDVLETIPLFHPIWVEADPDGIVFADTHAAHGNFRTWAQLTPHTRTVLARTGRPRVDQEVLRWAFSRRGSAS